LAGCVFLSGCVGFERQWQQSVAAYRAGEVETPEGPWQGSWKTTNNDHTGDLRAIVKADPDDPGEYRFRYHATWARFFAGTFGVDFPVERSGGEYHVDGDHDLGLFGTFRHRASISDDSFEATYGDDDGNVGRFSMTRPAADGG